MSLEPLAGSGPEVLFNATPIRDHVIPSPLEAGTTRARIDTNTVDNLRAFSSLVTSD